MCVNFCKLFCVSVQHGKGVRIQSTIFEDKVLKKIFRPIRIKVSEQFKILPEELCNLYTPSNTVRALTEGPSGLEIQRMEKTKINRTMAEKHIKRLRHVISYLLLHTTKILVMISSSVWLHTQRTANLAWAGVPDVTNACHSGTR
jgi:hypothetical protein